MPETNPEAVKDEMVEQLRMLARKQEGHGMSLRNDQHAASLNLYGDRARAAIWLFQNADRIADHLSARTPSAGAGDAATSLRITARACRQSQ